MIHKKEVRLVVVPYLPEKFESGMLVSNGKDVTTLTDNDLRIIYRTDDVLAQHSEGGRSTMLNFRAAKLYLICDDEIGAYVDVLLPSGEIKRMSNNDMVDYLGSGSAAAKKIVATSDQIGWVVNRPPYETMLSKFLFKKISEEHINEILDNGGKCWIEMDDPQARNHWTHPRLTDGKVMIHISEQQ